LRASRRPEMVTLKAFFGAFGWKRARNDYNTVYCIFYMFFFPVPVCAITASGVPGGALVSMNRFSTLCG
jgi:hypothetical protein